MKITNQKALNMLEENLHKYSEMSLSEANNLAKKGYNAYQILKYFYANTKFAKINSEYYK